MNAHNIVPQFHRLRAQLWSVWVEPCSRSSQLPLIAVTTNQACCRSPLTPAVS